MPSVEVNPVKQLETVALHPKLRSAGLWNVQLKWIPLVTDEVRYRLL